MCLPPLQSLIHHPPQAPMMHPPPDMNHQFHPPPPQPHSHMTQWSCGSAPRRSRVATLVQWFDGIGPLPTEIANGLGTGLRWLRAHAPADTGARLVHRDFRTGNFLVADGRLTAVLDWEFAGWGDPAEDFGWFCAACWRGDARGRAAGGLGARESFHEAYTAAGGTVPDRERVRFWEGFAHLRWTLIALQQGARARAGAYPAWELEEAATAGESYTMMHEEEIYMPGSGWVSPVDMAMESDKSPAEVKSTRASKQAHGHTPSLTHSPPTSLPLLPLLF